MRTSVHINQRDDEPSRSVVTCWGAKRSAASTLALGAPYPHRGGTSRETAPPPLKLHALLTPRPTAQRSLGHPALEIDEHPGHLQRLQAGGPQLARHPVNGRTAVVRLCSSHPHPLATDEPWTSMRSTRTW